jgi:hypothetical protein
MKQGNIRNNRQSSDQSQSRSSCAAANAAKALHYQQIAQIIERYSTPTPEEPCLSPLLWSESFGLRLDG